MKCNHCGLENPKQSKFCKKCGTSLEVHLKCSQCGSENPGDSLFCIACGARLSGIKKSVKGTQRRCRNCGHFNELDALYCVVCGEEMIRVPKENFKQQTASPSYKTIALVIGMIFLAGVSVKLGITFSKRGSPSKLNSAPAITSTSMATVDETQVIAVAKNFKCACGGCGELPLATCNCDMPKGSVEEKRFIREKLAKGFTVEQVIELLDKKYGHRV
jgi:ribosomal protein L40E